MRGGKHIFYFIIIIGGIFFWNVSGVPSYAQLIGGPAVESSPDIEYRLSDQCGPWLVMASVFGDVSPQTAKDKAHKLVVELRKKYNLKAYLYERKGEGEYLKDGQPYWVIDKKNPEYTRISRSYRYKNPSCSVEYVVFVGNFPSSEDRNAQNILKNIRKIKPECLKTATGYQVTHPLYAQVSNSKDESPMERAFLTVNPLLPKEKIIPQGLDSVVLAANKRVKRYSLLDCPGMYSVQVASLTGVNTMDQKKIARLQQDPNATFTAQQTLADADEKADKLAHDLRKKGYEAYVFRDHYASVVTIGSFNSCGNTINGEFVPDPGVLKIVKEFSAGYDPSTPGVAGIRRKSLNGVPFDLTPHIIVVPRRPAVNTRAWR